MVAKKIAAAVAAAAMTVALAACGGGGNSGSSGGGGGSSDTLTLGAIVPASTQSAADSRWANESPYMQAVYDTLVHLSPTGEPEPWLATEWSLNEDKTVLTLTLRTDVKFSDGEPFNADAAAQNILRFRDGTSPNASNLVNVKDAKAVDDATLEITLDAARPGPARLPGPERRPDGEPEAVRRLGRADQAGRLGSLRHGHRQDRRRLQVRLHQERRLLGSRQRVLRQPGHHRPRGQEHPGQRDQGRPGLRPQRHRPDDPEGDRGRRVHALPARARLDRPDADGPRRLGERGHRQGRGPSGDQLRHRPRRDAPGGRPGSRHGHRPGLPRDLARLRRRSRRGLPVRPREGQGAAGRRRLRRRLRARHAAAPGGHDDELRPGQAVPRRRGHHGQLHPARHQRRDRGHRRRQVRRDVLPAADGPDRVAGGELPAHRDGDVQPLPPA